MSEDNPDVPRNPPPHPGGTPQQPKGGSIGLGVLLGALALYAVYLGATIPLGGPTMWPSGFLGGTAAFLPIILYLLVSVLLALRRRTSRFGAGLLIGLGMFTLLGGGLCVGALAQMGA
ncbi:hypothetical protein TV39_19910 [Arthrobacter sp. SPG23]|uniref:hypothetical protein n=1 Tax=Arthrobacter sp. SPG23 TaxID=1610703 RepID=UPI0005B8AD66|nr:hypothetical protein [Arthrobacter sp. SPG23]KIS25755.1 hypothetical protein TV39_19910 [Arthrobacter sp. SPG23]